MTLQQALQQRGVQFRPGQRPGQIKVCCPFCVSRGESADSRFRLSINVQKNIAHCYNCNYKSRSIAKRLLAALRLPQVAIDTDISNDTKQPQAVTLPEGYHLLTKIQDELDQQAYDYLLKRGITLRQIQQNRIGASFLGDYAYRVIFPVYDGKELRGFVSRALHANMKPRYLNSIGDKTLYNFRPAPCIVLLEGIFKALRVERVLRHVGADACACALLGHDITELQLQQISKADVGTIVLWPDPDLIGYRGMLKVAQKLPRSIKVKVILAQEPADEALFAALRDCWQEQIPFSWSVGNRLLTGPQNLLPRSANWVKIAFVMKVSQPTISYPLRGVKECPCTKRRANDDDPDPHCRECSGCGWVAKEGKAQ